MSIIARSNKFGFTDDLYHPVFREDGTFCYVLNIGAYALTNIRFSRQPRVFDIHEDVVIEYKFTLPVNGKEWIPEEELFTSEGEALKYAEERIERNLQELKTNLQIIKKQQKGSVARSQLG